MAYWLIPSIKWRRNSKMELMENEFIVFCHEHYNPLGVIRSLGENGIFPIAIVVSNGVKITSKSRYISKLHLVASIPEGYEILVSHYGLALDRKSFLFSCDDTIQSFLDSHFNELNGRFVFFNAGEEGRLEDFMNKEKIVLAGKRHGLNVLPVCVTKRGVVPENLEYPLITKAISSIAGNWKKDVFICHNESELSEAFSKIKSPIVLLQKYIKKKNEYCIEGFSVNHGRSLFLSIVSTYNYLLPDSYSPYMTVRNFDNSELYQKLSSLIREIGYEGILEIEFLIDQDDKLYFSEINFRNSTWSYASTCAGMNLPLLWAESMMQGDIIEGAYKQIGENFTAMVEVADFKNRVLSKQIGLIKWIEELRATSCKYYWNNKDKMPAISFVVSRLLHNQ